MSMIKREALDYSDGRTKQSFKDATDINKILKKAQRVGSLSHLQRHGAFYGDFSNVEGLLEANAQIARAEKVFGELPSELRREFNQDWSEFFRYVNDPANKDHLRELLPGLAEPGRQVPDVARTGRSASNPAVANPPADPTPTASPSAPGSVSASSTT